MNLSIYHSLSWKCFCLVGPFNNLLFPPPSLMRRFAPRPVLAVYHSLQLHTNYPPEPWNTREHAAFSLLLFPSNRLRFPPLSVRSIVFPDVLTHPRLHFFRAESTPTILHSFFLHSFPPFFCTVASHVCTCVFVYGVVVRLMFAGEHTCPVTWRISSLK